MGIRFAGLIIGTFCLFVAKSGHSQEKTMDVPAAAVKKAKQAPPETSKKKEPDSKPDAVDAPEDADSEAAAEAEADNLDVIFENTLEMCRDGEDNDADSHVDCDDQDCEIFAICIQTPADSAAKAAKAPAADIHVPVTIAIPETGAFCRDGIDNDHNGLIDCREPVCAVSGYCRKIMYERPEPRDKPPGLLVNAGFGLAMPNYRIPTAKTRWTDVENGEEYRVPFDPDMGVMLDLQLGYLFMPWIGAGAGFKSAFTYASNRELYFVTYDDPDDYKYVGSKYYGNISAFLRFQWAFDRIVPYMNLHVGYSVYQTTWHVYDADNTWSDIDEYEADDSNFIVGERTEIRSSRRRHFTFAVEPGIDVFVVRRMFGLGIKAWLPVVAHKNSEADNLGILFNMTFTPIWREPVRLKPEYAGIPKSPQEPRP